MSILQVRLDSRKSYLGLLAVAGLISLTIYMALAFPFQLFGLRQSETSEIKSVIIVATPGERTPTPEAYFLGEETPEELSHLLGHDQLTNQGKERLYLLGKFLKLRYYHLLLEGNPRRLWARSADTDAALESAQALLAGINPPKDTWCWWTVGGGGGGGGGGQSTSTEQLSNWQPKAIHTTLSQQDDLLSCKPQEACQRLETERVKWKNSTRYQQLLNEFRHDLQTLRADTGLEFEDDLEMLAEVEAALRTRKAFQGANGAPTWYTPTFASRLAHIADVTAQSRYSSDDTQRLLVGRLLHEIMANVRGWIHLDHRSTTSSPPTSTTTSTTTSAITTTTPQTRAVAEEQAKVVATAKQVKQVSSDKLGANVFLYMTDKDRLAALLSSLQIYSTQPTFGSLLLIELHYSPINEVYFMRLFTVSADSFNVFPEPLRVNPLACLDSAECHPQQFEQNIRHLMLDQASWRQACASPSLMNPTQASISDTATTSPTTNEPSSERSMRPTELTTPAATNEAVNTVIPRNTTDESFLDDHLIVGPTHLTESPLNQNTSTTSFTSVENLPNGSPADNLSQEISTTTGGPLATTTPRGERMAPVPLAIDSPIIKASYSDGTQLEPMEDTARRIHYSDD